MSFKNFPHHKFSKENMPEMLEFLRVAKEQSLINKNCDLKEYEMWEKLIPKDPDLEDNLKKCNEDKDIRIDLTASDEEQTNEQVQLEHSGNISKEYDKSSLNDVAYAIKENLETQQSLSETVINDITNCTDEELQEIFHLLSQTLNSEEIFHFGSYLQDSPSQDFVITFYCRYLLIPQIKEQYYDNLLTLLNHFSAKYPLILKNELLTELEKTQSEAFLQYIKVLNENYQAELLRDFIFNIDKFQENYLAAVDNLLNNLLEYDALNKLVEIFSKVADDYSTNKTFGKLLMNVVQFLGQNVVHLEQPLKYIIARHKSIWKSKLQKTFDNCCEDSVMLSQSFRY